APSTGTSARRRCGYAPLRRAARSARKAAPLFLPAAIGHGDDLEEVPARLLEVHAAPAVMAIDLAFVALAGIGPVVEPALLDAAEDGVEFLLRDEERVVLLLDLVVGVAEVERHVVCELDREEVRAERLRLRQAEERGKEIGRGAFVAHVDDGVIELDAHSRNTPLPLAC